MAKLNDLEKLYLAVLARNVNINGEHEPLECIEVGRRLPLPYSQIEPDMTVLREAYDHLFELGYIEKPTPPHRVGIAEISPKGLKHVPANVRLLEDEVLEQMTTFSGTGVLEFLSSIEPDYLLVSSIRELTRLRDKGIINDTNEMFTMADRAA